MSSSLTTGLLTLGRHCGRWPEPWYRGCARTPPCPPTAKDGGSPDFNELSDVESVLRLALGTERWKTLKEMHVSRWVEYERDLAGWLSDNEWDTLHRVCKSIALFANEIDDALRVEKELGKGFTASDAYFDPSLDTPPGYLGPDDLAHVRITLEVVEDALSHFRKLAGITELTADQEPDALKLYERYVAAGGQPVEPDKPRRIYCLARCALSVLGPYRSSCSLRIRGHGEFENFPDHPVLKGL